MNDDAPKVVTIIFKIIGHVERYLINIRARVTSHLHFINVIVFIIVINFHVAFNIEHFISSKLFIDI